MSLIKLSHALRIMRTCIRIMAATPNLESVTRDTITTGRTHASTLHLGRKYKYPLVFITHETDPEYEWRHKHGGSKRHKDHSDCTHEQDIQMVLKVGWFGPFTDVYEHKICAKSKRIKNTRSENQSLDRSIYVEMILSRRPAHYR